MTQAFEEYGIIKVCGARGCHSDFPLSLSKARETAFFTSSYGIQHTTMKYAWRLPRRDRRCQCYLYMIWGKGEMYCLPLLFCLTNAVFLCIVEESSFMY